MSAASFPPLLNAFAALRCFTPHAQKSPGGEPFEGFVAYESLDSHFLVPYQCVVLREKWDTRIHSGPVDPFQSTRRDRRGASNSHRTSQIEWEIHRIHMNQIESVYVI